MNLPLSPFLNITSMIISSTPTDEERYGSSAQWESELRKKAKSYGCNDFYFADGQDQWVFMGVIVRSRL